MRDTTTDRHERRLIVVDAENLLGMAPECASDACWEAAARGLATAVGYEPARDLMIVGAESRWAFDALRPLPGARLVVRDGESGADHALCDQLADVTFIAERFSGVVIASGDHEFVDPAAVLADAGVPVTIAALPTQASGILTRVATDVIWLERPALTLGERATLALAA